MAEALGIVGSVIAIVQISAKIISLCTEYSRAVKNANKDIAQLKSEIENIRDVFMKAKELLDGPHGEKLRASQALSETVASCRSRMEELEKDLEPKPGKGQKVLRRMGFRVLKWPFESPGVEKFIAEMGEKRAILSVMLTIDQTHLILGVDQKIDLVKLPVADGAAYDSHLDENEAVCHPDTRLELLRGIRQWADDPKGKSIFWLNGMAGTGKSTISRTIARHFADKQQLGASFFFKRGEHERANAARLFTTIAAQLVLKVPASKPFVSKAIHAEPDIPHKSLAEQFDKLIFQPLSQITRATNLIVVVDALDECDDWGHIRTILRLFSKAKLLTSFDLRIFLTSRPELPIRMGFTKMSGDTYQNLVLHQISPSIIEGDITRFLQDRLEEIKEEWNGLYHLDPDLQLPSDWPSEDDVRTLVQMAIPLFIFAATMCRFIGNPRSYPPDQLSTVLKYRTRTSLEKTYLPVLEKLLELGDGDPNEETILEDFRLIVGTIVMLEEPLSTVSLSRLLEIGKGALDSQLQPLHSVLSIPANKHAPVRILHLSFRDFLVDSSKRHDKRFWINESKAHKIISTKCLEQLSNRECLRENICRLKSPGALRSDIESQVLDENIPEEVRYACRYWVKHLERSGSRITDDDPVCRFLQEYFLYWIEALCLIGRAAESVTLIHSLQSLVADTGSTVISEFLYDAWRFALRNRAIIDTAPLQLYSSALIFAPTTSVIRKRFQDLIPRWMKRLPATDDRWSTTLQILEHSDKVRAVAFSPDGQLIASGSGNTVQLWDSTTGDQIHRLDGHLLTVCSVAFSPDGTILASGSEDITIRLWDSTTGEQIHRLEGHSSEVSSVVFSPVAKIIASSSWDKTIRLWDSTSGEEIRILRGHAYMVHSVTFSPDGKFLAFGSYDHAIRLWDLTTGKEIHSLERHTHMVRSVAFSPDGNVLASGSNDHTIRLWDPASGKPPRVLEGHSSTVESLAFSPDSKHLLSGSHDMTIRLWDLVSGEQIQTLAERHCSSIRSVAFSLDNKIFAYTFDGMNILLWDATSGKQIQTLEGHLQGVYAMAFSPDGKLLASGPGDGTIQLWDLISGEEIRILRGHEGPVLSMTFSQNGKLLASSSDDLTIRLWDSANGKEIQTLDAVCGLIYSVAFSPDSKVLASGFQYDTVRLWDLTSGEPIRTLERHSDAVNSLAFSPDGKLFATGCIDGTIRLWDSATGAQKHIFKTALRITQLSFCEQGSHLCTGGVFLRVDASFVTDSSSKLCHCSSKTQMSVNDTWALCGSEQVLWLPPDYRLGIWVVWSNIVVLGRAYGPLSFLEFDFHDDN